MGINNHLRLRAWSILSPVLLIILFCTKQTYAAKNGTFPDADDKEMESKFNQYSLPYGILGAISHILTYYVILCHYYSRRPTMPWRPLEKQLFNMCSVVVSSIVSITIAIVTLTRIRETQPLVVLAALQVVLGFIVDALNVHRFFKEKGGLIRAMVLWGAILYGISYASVFALSQMSSMSPFLPGHCSTTYKDANMVPNREQKTSRQMGSPCYLFDHHGLQFGSTRFCLPHNMGKRRLQGELGHYTRFSCHRSCEQLRELSCR
jgi:hypothetical protein